MGDPGAHQVRAANTGALAYLAARQLPSGAFNYQAGRTITPAWVTSQVLPATNGGVIRSAPDRRIRYQKTSPAMV